MSVQLVLKNSSVQDKEATAAQLAVGELALNYHSSGPFLQCEDSAGNIWRLGGVVIASTAPSSPSKGAWWLDSDDNHLYFYDGSSWIEIQTGEIVPGDITEGTARQLLQTNAAGNGTEWTSNIDVPGTLDVTGVATFDNNVVITGNLTVNGTTTTIDTTTLVVEDKNIELGVVGTPTDTTADGGGITVKGATDKTLTWVNSTGMWTSNQPFDVAGEVQCDSLDVDGDADITGTVTLHGNLDLQDNDRILLGADDDLDILHNGTNSVINNYTGKLILENYSDDKDIELKTDNGGGSTTTYILCDGSSGAVNLNHYGSNKLATTSTGINVTGTVTCDGMTCEGDATISAGSGSLIIKDSNTSGDAAEAFIRGRDSADANKWYVGSGSNADMYIHNYKNGDIVFGTNNTYRALFDQDGHFIPYTDDQFDLGSSTNQWRNGYFDGVVNCDGLTCDGTATIQSGAGLVEIKDTNSTGTGAVNYLRGVDSVGTTQWYVGNPDSSADIYLTNSQTSGDIYFQTSGTNRFSVSSDGHLIPSADDLYDLGNSSNQWRNAYFDGTVTCDGLTSDDNIVVNSGFGTVFIQDNNSSGTASQAQVAFRDSGSTDLGQIGYLDSANSSIYIKNSISGYGVIFGTNNTARCQVNANGHFVPNTDDTYDLGTSSLQWRDAFFDGTVNCDGAAINGKCTSEEQTATASAFNLANGNFWTFGAIAVPNPTNQAAGLMGSLRVTAAPTSFASNWKFPGGTYTAPTSFPAVAPFFVQASGTILVGSWTEGIA